MANKFVNGSGTEIATFSHAVNNGNWLAAPQIKSSISCSKDSFIGGEIFVPDGEKECYCDDKNFVDIKIIETTITWWKEQIQI